MQNIFVVSKQPWKVKIGDFGISKHIDDATTLHTSVFSVGYAAPEMEGSSFGTRGNDFEYTNAVDIWSLGCVVYKMLTGQVPFSSRPQLSDFYNDRVPFPTDPLLAKGVSSSAMAFVQALIKPDPSDRLLVEAALRSPWIPITDPEDVELLRDWSEPLQPAVEPLVDTQNRVLSALGRTELAQFLNAAASGNNDAIWILRDRGIDINTATAFGSTALHEAASHGQNSTIKLLLNSPEINKEARDNRGNTPLLAAAWAAHFTSLKILIDHGANPRVMNDDGVCALHAAAKMGQADCTRTLLQKSVPASLAEKDTKMTPLHYAAAQGSVEVMKMLIEHEAEINLQDSKGWTPLHYTAQLNREDCARLLLQKNASLYSEDRRSDHTPLSVAFLWDSTEVKNIFLQHLAEFNVLPQSVGVEFHDAVRHNHIHIARLLIDSGFDVKSGETTFDITPLDWALQVGSVGFLEMLIEEGSNLFAVGSMGPQIPRHRSTELHLLRIKNQAFLSLRRFLQALDDLAKLGESVSSKLRNANISGLLARLTDLAEKLTQIICAWKSDLNKIPIRDFERLAFFKHDALQTGPGLGAFLIISNTLRHSCADVLTGILQNLEKDADYYSEDKNMLANLLSRSRNHSTCNSIETEIKRLRNLHAKLLGTKMAPMISGTFWGEINSASEAS